MRIAKETLSLQGLYKNTTQIIFYSLLGGETMTLSDQALEKRREYYRQYREKNRERYNQIARNWRAKPENKLKIQSYNQQYWERKAEEEQ